jgi:hypothetical protein
MSDEGIRNPRSFEFLNRFGEGKSPRQINMAQWRNWGSKLVILEWRIQLEHLKSSVANEDTLYYSTRITGCLQEYNLFSMEITMIRAIDNMQ